MTRHSRRLFPFIVSTPLFLLFVAISGVIVMQLWNWLLPALFQLPPVTYWQALGLLALSRILFGGVGTGRGGGGPWMRHRMAARWHALSPEERERVRRSIHDRFDAESA